MCWPRARAVSPHLRVLRHDRAGGQSAGVHSGVRAARGAIIATLDGDGQNPPEELPKLIAPLARAGGRGNRHRCRAAGRAAGYLVEARRVEGRELAAGAAVA